MLGTLLGINNVWARAIEGSLGSVDPVRWRALVDFVEEAKPAGSVVICGPGYFF